ncbi:hypothetical protein [Paraconexibacter sp. AEG42_29]
MSTSSPRRFLSRLLALTIASAALLTLATPPAAQAAAPGLNVAFISDAALNPALATGAKYIRMFVAWEKLEPEGPGQYPGYTNIPNPGAANNVAEFDNAIRTINKAGAKPIFVIVGAPQWANGSTDVLVPPKDPASYASFFGRFVDHTSKVGDIAAYEVWNEEDAAEFWHGPVGVDSYGPMLRQSYDAAKKANPNAVVLTGATTGNNAAWIKGLYDAGLKGKFDGVAVHTDTACLQFGPDRIFRDIPGSPLNQYTFLGYRSVRDVMVAAGDANLGIWMTELGWSSTTTTCERGASAGKAPAGAGANQARFLTQAYQCMAHDPYVVVGAWFTFSDQTFYSTDELNKYGIVDSGGAPKPSYAAFKTVADANGGAAGPCGDTVGPTVAFAPNQPVVFSSSLLITGVATDQTEPGVAPAGLKRIVASIKGDNIFALSDSAPEAATKAVDGVPASRTWGGAKDLPDGNHVITITAVDNNNNVNTANLTVCKGASCSAVASASYTPKVVFATGKQPACKRLRCTIKGTLRTPAGQTPAGRVRVEWQSQAKTFASVKVKVGGKTRIKRVVKLKWATFHKGGAAADKPFTFRQTLKRKGKWRVRVLYDGVLPALKTTSAFKSFTAR